VLGHTDSSGTKEANQTLSRARAQAIQTRLEAKLGQGKAMTIRSEGLGDQQPLAERPEANRCVTFKIEIGS
jgi:outer membrane protein OmpA-like peptidoglycan-associated protein